MTTKGRQYPDDRFISGTEAAGGKMPALPPVSPTPDPIETLRSIAASLRKLGTNSFPWASRRADLLLYAATLEILANGADSPPEIRLVFDGGDPRGDFLAVKDADGRPLVLGTWVPPEDGSLRWEFRIPLPTILSLDDVVIVDQASWPDEALEALAVGMRRLVVALPEGASLETVPIEFLEGVARSIGWRPPLTVGEVYDELGPQPYETPPETEPPS